MAWLYDLQTHGIKLGLQGIRALLDILEHPESGPAIVLVGGTNGKGSVAAMLDAVIARHGLRAGLYSSPHLVRPNERIRIEGVDLPDPALDRCLARVKAACERGLREGRLEAHPSFFEVMTAAALLAFHDAAVRIAVLEVGLGGRLDATNATEPIVSTVVTVDLDHVAILGGTLREIALEKGAIARRGRPLVSGATQPEAIEALRACCASTGAEFRDARAHPLPTNLHLALDGVHQRHNARVALATLEALAEAIGLALDAERVREGLATARWPGRLQRVRGEPDLLLDGAHNPAGASALARHLASHAQAKPVLLFATMADKDARAILAPLAPHVAAVVTTRPEVGRAADPDDLARTARALGLEAECHPRAPEALARARALAGPQGLVLVAGSLYLVGAVLTSLEGDAAPGPVAM